MNEANEKLASSFLKNINSSEIIRDVYFPLRQKSWERFCSLDLHTLKKEMKFNKLLLENFIISAPQILMRSEVEPWVLSECQHSFVVFVNGFFCADLSDFSALPSKVSIMSLEDGSHIFGSFINNSWQKNLKEEEDPFALINAAIHPKGMFLYLPPKTILERPLQIIQVISGYNHMHLPRMHVFAGSHSQINIIHTYHCKNLEEDKYVMIPVTEIHLEEGADVRNVELVNTGRGWSSHINTLRAFQKSKSSFKAVSICEENVVQNMNVKVDLAGENAEASIYGLSFLSEQKESRYNICVEHKAPYCKSNQVIKSVLKDCSRFRFTGSIKVRPQAQKTEATQRNNNLLLSDQAKATAKPHLEIFADDVKVSHGATIGGVDKDSLFYLNTKGLSQELAQSLLVKGFCEEIYKRL